MAPVFNIAAKDTKVMIRDRAALLVMLAMPLALIFILGSALGNMGEGDSLDVEVAIVNLDEGETGARFVEGLTSSDDINAVFNIAVREDTAAVRREVERGDLTAALIIPEDLTEQVQADNPVALEVLQDPGSQMSAGIWAGVVRAGVASASAQIIAVHSYGEVISQHLPPPVEGFEWTQPQRPWSEMRLDGVQVREVEVKLEKQVSILSYYAGSMTGMFLLFGAMFGAFSFVRERREQTLARMLATPARKAEIVAGKALGVFLIGTLQFLVLYLGTRLLFQVDWGTNVAGVLMVGASQVLVAAGLAMTLAALGRSERAIGGIAPAFIMLFAALGGSMIPIEQLPSWLLPVQVLSPVYWTVDALSELMRGAGTATVLPNIGALLAIAATLLAFGVWRLRYE